MLEGVAPIQVPFSPHNIAIVYQAHAYEYVVNIRVMNNPGFITDSADKLYEQLLMNEEFIARLEEAYINSKDVHGPTYSLNSELEYIMGEIGEIGPDKLW